MLILFVIMKNHIYLNFPQNKTNTKEDNKQWEVIALKQLTSHMTMNSITSHCLLILQQCSRPHSVSDYKRGQFWVSQHRWTKLLTAENQN